MASDRKAARAEAARGETFEYDEADEAGEVQ